MLYIQIGQEKTHQEERVGSVPFTGLSVLGGGMRNPGDKTKTELFIF